MGDRATENKNNSYFGLHMCAITAALYNYTRLSEDNEYCSYTFIGSHPTQILILIFQTDVLFEILKELYCEIVRSY